MRTTLTNDLLEVTIDSHGAEVVSVVNRHTGKDYIWNGDKRFWGRHSPVLFPLVGQVWEGRYRLDGEEYRLGQHGFARDCEFTIIDGRPDDEAWFALEADEETLEVYPRRFRLEIGYRLQEARLTVMWHVTNLDERTMYFHIGAHPAFNLPDFNPTDRVHGYLAFDNRHPVSQLLGERGGVVDGEVPLDVESDGFLPLTAETFSRLKTIILGESQVRRVSLLDAERRPWLSVMFSAPVVGLWSPAPDAPFVCIEPWWGRADREEYEGDFSDREYTNRLFPSERFEAVYMIIFDNF
ncbi:MAG: aldose 1-epimerase family protein [Clostridium sp.]|nr:aldose 1-epimerase family protein [Clostridium sp.]